MNRFPKMYDNAAFDDIDCGGHVDDSIIKGQWETGLADPFILRFNGMYYLYATTSGLNNFGLRGWKSPDLLHWEPCRGEGLPLGYVVTPEGQDKSLFGQKTLYTQNAYAPEVYYFDGFFYMFTSPGYAANPRGHYILKSRSPEGPFVYHAGPLDTRIDGSLLIDDDERMYFFHATPNHITVRELKKGLTELSELAAIPSSDLMGGWTEGPALTKIAGKYYLTYTGLHYQTPGYQVCYAVADKLDKSSPSAVASSFRRGAHNPMLLNCDEDEGHVGNGHSANFLGPDLDSHYIVYHNLDKLYPDGMTHRSMNIDRLLVYEGLMSVAPNKTGSVCPEFPVFSSYGGENLVREGDFLLAEKTSKDRFSAEFNLQRDENARCVFSWKDPENYFYVKADFPAKKLCLCRVRDGIETCVAKGRFVHTFSWEDVHTVLVACEKGRIAVFFDGLKKIERKLSAKGGRIGYRGGEKLKIGYTALSRHAFGSSDRAEIKQSHAEIPSALFLPRGEERGTSPRLARGSGVAPTQTEEGEYAGLKELRFTRGKEYVRYRVLFKERASYGLVLVLHGRECGKKISLRIDGGKRYDLEVPTVTGCDADYVRVLLGPVPVSAGAHIVTIGSDEPFSFVSFTFEKTKFVSFENSLSRVPSSARRKEGSYKGQNGALHAEGKRCFLRLGGRHLHDFEANIELNYEGGEGSFGVIFRQDNFASSVVPAQNFTDGYCHIQGYYLQIAEEAVTLSRYNFGKVKSRDIIRTETPTERGRFYSFRIVVKGNLFAIYRDGVKILEVCDPLAFQTGSFGLYSTGGSGRYQNLSITAPSEFPKI